MDVSVIITAHKDRGFLQQAIDSVKSQKFNGSFEIILASDNNPDLINYAIKNNIHFCLNRKTNNLASNFNNAVKYAKGKYLKILADDDMLIDNALQSLFDSAKRNDADVVFSDFMMINEAGNVTGQYITPCNENTNIQDLIIGKKIAGGCSLIKRSSFNAVGGFDKNYNIAEGYILNIKLIKNNFTKFVYLPEFTVNYRIHTQNKSINLSKENAEKRQKEMTEITHKYHF